LLTQIDVFEEESALDYKDIHDRFAVFDVDMQYLLIFYQMVSYN
jgi:hypothetical protein